MTDPVSIAVASFTAIKKGFQIGRDLESMMGDLSRWMGALSDLEQQEKEAKNPPIFNAFHFCSYKGWSLSRFYMLSL